MNQMMGVKTFTPQLNLDEVKKYDDPWRETVEMRLSDSMNNWMQITFGFPPEHQQRIIKILQHSSDIFESLLDTHKALMAMNGANDCAETQSVLNRNKQIFKSIAGEQNESQQ